MDCRIATQDDKDKVMALITQTCSKYPEGVLEEDQFKQVAALVLQDIDWGFFILAETKQEPVGLLYFSYEWSDWRDGCFFWLQTAYAQDINEEENRIVKELINTLNHQPSINNTRLVLNFIDEKFYRSNRINKSIWKGYR